MEFNYYFSFRGRKNIGYAHWKRNEIENVIRHSMNLYPKCLEEQNTDQCFEQNWVTWFTVYFSIVDFHEWLHLFIRRKSGIKGTYHVTDECEDFIHMADGMLANVLIPSIPDRDLIQYNPVTDIEESLPAFFV